MNAVVSAIDWDVLQQTSVQKSPFPHLIVPGFIAAAQKDVVNRDFPDIQSPGSFPAATLHCGDAFSGLLEELRGARLATLIGEKFGMELGDRETMITVRGQCRSTDGKIHLDSKGKLITILIYMNGPWESDGGRLRLLNGPDDIEDYFAETPPSQGTMLAFACADNAWHGHKSFSGRRRAIQLNWVRDERYLRRERQRHTVSAALKKVSRFFRLQKKT
ncbi:2OG-Fe(II) oxygenase [Candidatus Persebacteraceae bacterium Df01]|jgi:hypothetical protein|uniref:2OG-Fe(II) oxygenase n=1 Tax=Candidatus Doriopsillibacter californiensis TaxID=2970740 RepID=A0ABT7QJN5_9GAMM|nr:2OG-Fe(II) oxygenase [Candidatus Persebacteraceae bacterium Df01]